MRGSGYFYRHELAPQHAAIGSMLQDLYDRIAQEPLPAELEGLLQRLTHVGRADPQR